MERPLVTAQAVVNATLDQTVEWFMALKDHPERYRFASHDGFTFTHGDFGVGGARFETRERFYGLRLTLRFELTAIESTQFRFRLRHLPVWGAFVLEQVATGAHQSIFLRLHVGGTTATGKAMVRCPIIHSAIKRQIQGEVDNIKASMEGLYGPPTHN